jgi:hypothetical protein
MKYPLNFLHKYPFCNECKHNYSVWKATTGAKGGKRKKRPTSYNYSRPASNSTHEMRITRAVLVYFPMDKLDEFKYELKWLYRSWIHMISYEPVKWRTDLIIFSDYNASLRVFPNQSDFFLTQLNCRVENRRQQASDRPMCTLMNHKPIGARKRTSTLGIKKMSLNYYRGLLARTNVFGDDFSEFYFLLSTSKVNSYNYLDSILMAFEGYDYFKSYDFIIRSDMDVFLTPLFARWLPRYCNDFYVGRGGYSTDFNTKRFQRIAANLNFNYAGLENLGSTWYSSPSQMRLVAFLTLFGMVYLSNEEFSPPERDGKLGTLLWPDWHYGVLLLYGQHLALNHLTGGLRPQINLVKLDDQLDFPSGNRQSIFLILNIHVFHGDNLFSKFAFKMGKYDNKSVSEGDMHMVKYYALKMALDGKRISSRNLNRMLTTQIKTKL